MDEIGRVDVCGLLEFVEKCVVMGFVIVGFKWGEF